MKPVLKTKTLPGKAFFLLTGVRLHIKLYILKALKVFDRYEYCIAFPSVEEGLRAEKHIRGFKAVSVPVPDEIVKECGVGVLVGEEDLDRLLEHLEGKGIKVLGVYRKSGSAFVEVRR